ncbi:MAG: BrnT family toxin [Rhodospirillales bacterium]|nr:BrnT family toxin [Rhodospirillales bacterium]
MTAPTGFEWDEKKRRFNLSKHRIDFREIPKVFRFPLIEDDDLLHSEKEPRRKALGYLDGRVVFFVYTMRRSRRRIVTARPATRDESVLYYQRYLFDLRSE